MTNPSSTQLGRKARNVDDVLARLNGVKKYNGYFQADCPVPGHQSPTKHLTIKDAGDKVLVTCHGGKHSYQDICQALGFDSLTYSDSGRVGTTIGKPCYGVTPSSNRIQTTVTPPTLQPVTGVTVSALAEAKRLPVDFLKSLGIGDFKYNGQPAVRIPYYTEDGQEVAMRFRLALKGESRFKWRKGDHALPYGLNRLEQIRKAGWVLVVEGESDCWTAWYHNIPALGAPGKGVWPPIWGEYLEGLGLFVWQEPEAEDFTLRILKSAPDLRFLRAPDGLKDISEAHVQGVDIPTWLEGLKSNAESGQALKAQYTNEQAQRLYHEAKAIIEAEDPLELVKTAIRDLGYGGDTKPAVITYLSMTSRIIEMRDGAMPVHLLLSGQSSSGKSYTLAIVLKLLPAEAYQVIDAGSPRVLIYNDASLEHRALIFGEADSLPAGEDNPAASAVRNLLQDHHLHYEVTIRDGETGNYWVKRVQKPGPTVMITTSTRSLGAQLSTRLFTLEIPDSKEQITAALETQAVLETKGLKPLDGALVSFQHYLQLKAPLKVIVPFAGELAKAMSEMTSAPRILRDFARLLSLIKSVAIIRHHWRQTDNESRLVAILADYGTVRELVNDMYIDSNTGANNEIRRLVKAVKALDASRTEGERITVTKLATYLDTSKMAASRRAKKALKEGWLLNRESRRGYPADFTSDEPMPETEGLPLLGGNTVTDHNAPPVTDISLKNGGCNTVTGFTDVGIPPPPNNPDNSWDYPTHACPKCGGEWAFNVEMRYVCEHCGSHHLITCELCWSVK